MYKVWMKRRGEQPRFRSSFDLIGTFHDKEQAEIAMREAVKNTDKYAYGSVQDDDGWPYPDPMYSKG